MSPEVWVAIGTGLLALATFVLAVITALNVKKTGALVAATQTSADAAKATVEEIQKDRELAHRPYLSWNAGINRNDEEVTAGRAFPVNFGRGPVVNGMCCFAWTVRSGSSTILNLMTSDLFDLSADSDKRDGLQMTIRAGIQADEEITGNEVTNKGVKVAFCQDQLGNYYRFVPYTAPEIFRPKVGAKSPKWIDFYADQFMRLAKP